MNDALDELAARTRTLLAAGRSGEAVLSASQLVEAVSGDGASRAPADLAEAIFMLAQAFEADGDVASAEQVVRTFASRSAAPHLQVRASSLVGRYLRQQGDLSGSARHLGETLEHYPGTTDADARTALGGVRAELVLTLRELGARAWADGLIADSVEVYRAAVGLLAPDRSVAARRERAGLCVSAAQGLAMLQRWDELSDLCDGCFAEFGDDSDAQTVESAVVAACMSAQAALALGRPDDALRLASQLAGTVPAHHPHRTELEVRIGLARAAAELETHGSAAAEAVYAAVTQKLADNPEPGTRVFLAIALELECAMLCQLDRMERAAEVGRALAEVIARFPGHEDFATAAECGNRAAERLISYGEVHVAARIAGEVTSPTEERLAGDDRAVRLRGYVIQFDALRRSDQRAALETCWSEIIALDDDALVVLDGLAERYREHPALRAALLDTYIGRAAVLSNLGRMPEAEQTVRDVFTEFGRDDDEQVQRMLRGLRGEPGDQD